MTSGLRETSYNAAISSVVTTPDLQHTHTHTHTQVQTHIHTEKKEEGIEERCEK
jgi:hypothetical protein